MLMTALGIGSALAGIGSTIYNLWSNKRDHDYQKSLQQEVFEREDTAVQRRMQDLESAGLNPNLAAGSAAASGSVVARSNTNDINPGAALDMLSAVNQIKQQKQQIENARTEGEILRSKQELDSRQNLIDEMTTLHQLGFKVKPKITGNGKITYEYWDEPEKPNILFDNLDYQNSYYKNSADLIQKDNDWYTTDKVSGLVLGSLGLLKPQFSGGKK